jgi:hypothetical protein
LALATRQDVNLLAIQPTASMKPTRRALVISCLALDAAVTQQPPVRPIGAVTHVSAAGVLGSVTATRALPDGRVIVNDLSGRQLRLFERDLAASTVLADSTAATGRTYGGQFASLIAFRGDSSLFIEPQSMSMAVLDHTGATARVMGLPRPADGMFLMGGPFGTPGFDSREHLVYRGMGPRTVHPPPTDANAPQYMPSFPDSAPVFRINIATRQRDTVTWVRVPTYVASRTREPSGLPVGLRLVANPIPVVDVWTMMADGRLAVVRGADFHVDWFDATGERVSTPKIPFPWQRLDDDAKQRLADSAKTAADERGEASRRAYMENPSVVPPMIDALMRPLGTLIGRAPGSAGGRPLQEFVPTKFVMPPLDQLPSYRPAFEVAGALAAPDGTLWVRTTAPSDRGAIYYVLNSRGELVDRVQIPFGRIIAGFGKGVVYMGVLDDKGARLEVANLR